MNYKSQAVYNTIGNISYLFSQWLLTVITTRMIGVDSAGVFSLAISAGNIFFFIQTYGMRSYQVSDVSGLYSPGQYVYSRYITAAIGILLCAGFVFFSGYDSEKASAILGFLLYRTFEAVSDVYFGELQKIGRLDILASSMVFKSISSVFIFTAVLAAARNLSAALFAVSAEAMLITLLYDRNRYIRLVPGSKDKLEPRNAIPPLKSCFSLMVSTLLPIIVTSYPKMKLDSFCGSEILGYYSNVSTPTVLITAVVPSILTPIMTLYGKWILGNEQKKLLRGYLLSLAGTIAFGVFCELGVLILGDYVMSFIFTDDILPYMRYLYPLLIVMTIYAMTMCGNSLLISLRKNKAVLIFSMLAALICVVISGLLISNYEIWGVIFSMGISYAVQLLCQFIYIAIAMKKINIGIAAK